VIFEWIHRHRQTFDLGVLCDVHGVCRGGYYAWVDRTPSSRDVRREQLTASIRRIHGESDATYGSPRVHQELVKEGESINRKTVEKYMKRAGISGESPKRFVPRTTDSDHDHRVADNVLGRDFAAEMPNRKWAGDITYVWTDEGWLYLAAIIDLCSRRIVGWSMAPHLRSDLCEEALTMAISNRRPGEGLIHHTDRGSQYASESYREILQWHDITPSMSRRGDCWDNAVMESFWSTLKREHVDRRRFSTRAEARSSIFEWIEGWYNRRRSHSAIGYVSPEQFEASLN
jgi:putative transposase